MKEKMMKAGNIILNGIGFILSLWRIFYAVRRESAPGGAGVAAVLGALVLAAVFCPCSYWFLRKKLGERRPVAVRVVRGVVLALSPFAIGFILLAAPFYRCFDFSISNQAEKYFEKHMKTDATEYKGVRAIKKPAYRDYREITATVEYEDRESGQVMQEDVTMYFGQFEGMYFETFEELRQYRRECAETSLHERSHFEENAFNERIYAIAGCLAENDYEGVREALTAECSAVVTKEKWDAWQERLSLLGTYKKVEDIEPSLQVADDRFHSQTITAVVTMQFADGVVKVTMTLDEELKVTKMDM